MEINKKRTIEARLREQRQDLIKKRLGTVESWQSLHENEIEFEEKATNEQLAAGLKQLDEQDKKKIEAIDYALGRIQADDYDVCESCGEYISEKRLEAVPWTNICIDCAAEMERQRTPNFAVRETGPAGDVDYDEDYDEEDEVEYDEVEYDEEDEEETEEEGEEEVDFPAELEGLSDEQLESVVLDAFREDGSVNLEELTVSCHHGKLRLSGFVPDKKHLSHLRQIVYDELGFRDVEDTIKVDRIPWERNERTPDMEPEETAEDDIIEGDGIEIIEAIKEGKSMAPTDEIIPEAGRRGKS